MAPSAKPLPVQDLHSLLKQNLGKDCEIKNVEWRPLTDPGENFGSLILAIDARVTWDNKTETLHLVTKLPPTSAYLLDLFNSAVTFQKELQFYSTVPKEFIKLQQENGITGQDLNNLAPRYIGGRLGLHDPDKFDDQAAIVLENLKYLGYTSEDRIFGLDKEHMIFAVEKLAKLHALTVGLKIKKPDVFKGVLTEILKPMMSEVADKCVQDMIRKAQEDLKNIDEARPYLERVNRTVEYGIEMNRKPAKVEEPWGTMVHNDFWVNNMMFRHNDRGDLIDMKIVDFQLSVYDYGVKDLIFFLVSSAKKDILDNNLNDMIDLYYDAYTKMLQALNVDTDLFTKNKYDELVKYCATLKFNQCFMMAQVIQASRESAAPLEEIKNKDIFLGKEGDDIYKKKLVHIVHIFDKMGWLLK